MRVYVASSWRNDYQPDVIRGLRELGHDVYDFRHPAPGNSGFHWSEIDAGWKRWRPEEFIKGLSHPVAKDGFALDFAAMREAQACVLLLPCGRSAHLEAGYFVGSNKPLLILLGTDGRHSYSNTPCPACGDLDGCHGGLEPELMYRMADSLHVGLGGLLIRLQELEDAISEPTK